MLKSEELAEPKSRDASSKPKPQSVVESRECWFNREKSVIACIFGTRRNLGVLWGNQNTIRYYSPDRMPANKNAQELLNCWSQITALSIDCLRILFSTKFILSYISSTHQSSSTATQSPTVAAPPTSASPNAPTTTALSLSIASASAMAHLR